MRSLIKNATIVNEGRSFSACLAIENDCISEIAEGMDSISSESFDMVINANGCFLLPGIIDTHVHFREPGLTHKADFHSESRAAAAGGVTTVFDMPNTLPQTTTLEAWKEKCVTAKNKCLVNYGIFFGATHDNVEKLSELDPKKTPGIKLFMGSSTGNMLVDDGNTLNKIFQSARLPIVTHCENSDIIARNQKRLQEKFGEDPDVSHHPDLRSEEACLQSTSCAVELAKKYNARLHVAHLTTEKELELFDDHFPNITAEVCVAHLLFSEEDYSKLGTKIKCNPAIKKQSDKKALRKALNTGKIFTIATDHAPHLPEEKMGGCVKAASGMPMLQFSLVSMLELVDERVLSVEHLVELMVHNPARLFDIKNRGFLRPGQKADLVIVRKGKPWTLEKSTVVSKCGWSPLQGKTFNWQVEKTFCNGTLIYDKGSFVSDKRGEMVEFSR